MTDVSLARQRLQHRVGTAVAAIARATDISAGEGCDIFLALWDLSDEDGEGFSGSIRNSAAFRVFCTQLAGLVHQLDEDLASIRALQHVLTAFSLVHTSDSPPDIHPSFPRHLSNAFILLSGSGRWGCRGTTMTNTPLKPCDHLWFKLVGGPRT